MYVYLIGAGPGDPGLITCKGLRALSEADVVVYDYLAGDALMAHARPDAERVYVGKVAGNHAMSQSDINRLLVDKAKEGKVVARLKGGDPYIFGRGGEEAETLADAGVPFEEIPGVTSTIAGPAYAGIPLTHRAAASSVTLITGHEDPAKPGSVHDWQALARSASTLVFVMGMKNLPDIARNLIDAGLKPDTPAALVHWGTTDHQRSLTSTLADLPDAARREGFANPSIIVVGEVVRLRDKLNWFEKRPLFGRTVVITRAREQASDSAARFAALGARVIQFPTIAVKPLADHAELDAALDRLPTYDWLVFTSVNGVRFSANVSTPATSTPAPWPGSKWRPSARLRPRPCAPWACGPTSCPKAMWPKAWPKACSSWARPKAACSCPAPARPRGLARHPAPGRSRGGRGAGIRNRARPGRQG